VQQVRRPQAAVVQAWTSARRTRRFFQVQQVRRPQAAVLQAWTSARRTHRFFLARRAQQTLQV
jgi:hypothetical protein